MVEIYTHVSKPGKKEEIIDRFCKVNSMFRIVIATISFSMGIDCPDIECIFHWGLLRNIYKRQE